MSLPVAFASLSGGNQPLSLFDTQFAAVAALGAIPCAASGQNIITLTPLANTPSIAAYVDLQPSFVFTAAQTSNGSLSASVTPLGTRNIYKWNGQQQAGAGDIVAGGVYRLTPLQALNGGSGGFVVDSVTNQVGAAGSYQNGTIGLVIDGAGSAIAAGHKGQIGPFPFASTIAAWSLMADQSGSITIDILRANNAVPSTSIVGGGTKPNLTASQSALGVAPSGWTSVVLAPNDWLDVQVTALATSITRATLALSYQRS